MLLSFTNPLFSISILIDIPPKSVSPLMLEDMLAKYVLNTRIFLIILETTVFIISN